METFTDPKVPVIFQSLFESDKNISKHLVDGILPQFAPFSSIQCIEQSDHSNRHAPVVELLCEDKNGGQRMVYIWVAWLETFRSKLITEIKRCPSPYPKHAICFANLIINEASDAYCHRYSLADSFVFECPEGQDLIVIELPKFRFLNPEAPTEPELWLSFLADINCDSEEVPQHLLEHPHTAAALELVRFDTQSDNTIKACTDFLSSVKAQQAAIDALEKDMALLRRLYKI
ncbi:MAG: hypothetical protein LBD21_07610 [Tannerellaceae bacterium]|jgi:hypothetical protein|nr:hypothetical protein [Tannerellaceae bacterium]